MVLDITPVERDELIRLVQEDNKKQEEEYRKTKEQAAKNRKK